MTQQLDSIWALIRLGGTEEERLRRMNREIIENWQARILDVLGRGQVVCPSRGRCNHSFRQAVGITGLPTSILEPANHSEDLAKENTGRT